ncbi:YihY/virulence factor BrkB family protein [Pseudanabaena sp. PCC 6802]|uniref:YihY/virulence factor BrkB family protein n=1 Tax=Pseudanabaena sp. PCC 6802 TaxID=118173 RepID=UPI00034656F9|nr:YihY/virulence factor BrkB family protein [Pseudanabaena sp. PCC 6802]
MFQYFRDRILPTKPVQLLIQTGLKWHQDDCSSMAAALSYYALFSLFPILLVLLSILGQWIEPGSATFELIRKNVESSLPAEVYKTIEGTIAALRESRTGAGIIGFGLLLYSASTVFAALNNFVQKIWRVSGQDSIRGTVISFALNQLLSFLLVFGTTSLLFASLISDIAIQCVLKLVATFRETFAFVHVDELEVTRGLQVGSSLSILAIACCILFKILPSTRAAWQDTWLGALLSAGLLVGLLRLAGDSIISIGGHYLSYGVIGGAMILLLWLYLTCQIFLFGCEFSYTYAHLFGSRRNL